MGFSRQEYWSGVPLPCGSQQIRKFLKKKKKGWENQTTLPLSWETCVHQEATIRTSHGTSDWFKIGKGVRQGCILSLYLFNFYAEYIVWNARLDESQAGIKTAGRNINLRYADDTTLMTESEEVLKSLLMRVKEKSEKAGLKLNFQKLRSWPLILHGK